VLRYPLTCAVNGQQHSSSCFVCTSQYHGLVQGGAPAPATSGLARARLLPLPPGIWAFPRLSAPPPAGRQARFFRCQRRYSPNKTRSPPRPRGGGGLPRPLEGCCPFRIGEAMRIAPLRFNPWSHVEDLLCPLGAWLPGHRCVPSWQTKHKIRMGPWCCSREASSEQALAPSGLRNSPLLLLTPKLLSEICFVCDCSLHTMRCPSMGLGKATVWSFGLSVVARARSLS
jgi:hypothetical protein